MTAIIQQISDYGTSNPIVARLFVQTNEILQFYNLSEAQRNDLFEVFFINLQPKLLACFRIKEKLKEEVRTHQKSIDDHGVPTQVHGGGAYTLPYILDLDHCAETFLYNAKSVLRDLTDIFHPLFDKNFKKEARFDKVLKWARATLGEKDAFVEMLSDDQKWISGIVRMRNAVEHPGGYSGTLHIENFTSTEQGKTIHILEPVWYLNDDVKTSIVQGMEFTVTNLLIFCEETLVLCLEHFKNDSRIIIAEIPEAERNPACPVRYMMTIDPSKIKR